jgi:hypothetical protein
MIFFTIGVLLLALGCGLGRGLGGIGADGVTGEDEFYAAILLAAFGAVVAGDG